MGGIRCISILARLGASSFPWYSTALSVNPTLVTNRNAYCGWIDPGDLWLAPDGSAHILWTERAIDELLRKEFFPSEDLGCIGTSQRGGKHCELRADQVVKDARVAERESKRVRFVNTIQ